MCVCVCVCVCVYVGAASRMASVGVTGLIHAARGELGSVCECVLASSLGEASCL